MTVPPPDPILSQQAVSLEVLVKRSGKTSTNPTPLYLEMVSIMQSSEAVAACRPSMASCVLTT
jgi:hypothetical protein